MSATHDQTDENFLTLSKERARRLILPMYAGEPCRVCGRLLTMADLEAGAVFAGYSAGNKSRGAHASCWTAGVPKSAWAFPDDAV
ncbi:MAG TPA: hypothetical protein VK421_06260 [Pyrinomonadaceae bacterium]|nr:hypothetical protein [Pyrinomonadaceae bacterium]